jgi:hypothetical protein
MVQVLLDGCAPPAFVSSSFEFALPHDPCHLGQSSKGNETVRKREESYVASESEVRIITLGVTKDVGLNGIGVLSYGNGPSLIVYVPHYLLSLIPSQSRLKR